ncbi:MAG: PKD domain-containing protein [Methanobacterium sp.]|nr:PKD domain-containing protein [Methanobacterium sp.]
MAPLDVQFTDKSTGNVLSYSWNFGDGNTSTEQNPKHTFNTPGTYTVTLTITGPGGSSTETFTDYINVKWTVPVANFTVNATSGVAPLDVQFTDKSTGNVSSYSWNFGDGSTSTDKNTQHTYSVPGTYTVILTVNGPGGITTQTKYITVNYPAPIAGFTSNTTKGTAPLKVKFTDSSTGNVSGYLWNFGDGTTSTDQNPTHNFSKPGSYTVKLTVTNHGGSSSVSSLITVQNHILPTAITNVKGGLYNSDKTVTIAMSKSGSIYYTINGTTPTTSSKKYTGPISIKSSTTLKFIAVDLAGNKSPVYTNRYTIDKKAPIVTLSNPVNGAKNVSTTSTITINFNKLLKSSLNWSKIYIKNLSTGKLVSIKTTIKNNQLNIKMTYTRYSKNNYRVYIPKSAVKDNAGNNLTKDYYFSFKTK